MLLADYIASNLDEETVVKLLQLFGYKMIGQKTPEDLISVVLTLFKELQEYSLLTEESLQAFIQRMTVKPTFKKGITLVEKRCQLTHFIQDIVPFRIAIIDGQHRLGLTTAVIDNIMLDNTIPVQRYSETYDIVAKSPLHNPVKVKFMISSGLSHHTMELFRDVGRRESILTGLTFLFSTRDLLLHIHDAIALYHSEDVIGWDGDDDAVHEEETKDGIFVSDDDLKTKVYEKDDAFLKYRNFLIPYVSTLLLKHEKAKSWITLYLKNARLGGDITKENIEIITDNLKETYPSKKHFDFFHIIKQQPHLNRHKSGKKSYYWYSWSILYNTAVDNANVLLPRWASLYDEFFKHNNGEF